MCNHIVILRENPNSQMTRAQSGKRLTYLSTNLSCERIQVHKSQVVQSREMWILLMAQSG